MRRRPVAGLLLSLVVTATSGAAAANRIDTLDGGGGTPAEAARQGGTESDPIVPAALPPPPGKTLLVSRKKNGPGAPFLASGSIQPSIDADGSLVAFATKAPGLVPGDEADTLDVFVIDRATNNVRRAPRPRSPNGIGQSSEPSISADGTVVAFTWLAPTPPAAPTPTPTPPVILFAEGPPEPLVFAWVLRTNRIELVSRNARGAPQPGAREPSTSGSGRFIAYTSTFEFPDNGDDAARDVLRYDRQAKDTVLVSVGPEGGPAAGSAWSPSISGSGRLVAFVSDGSDTVVHEATGERGQIYVRDMDAKQTVRVSKAADGGPARGPSDEPAISGDGTHVAFTSIASNLVDGFSSQFPMVYRRNLAAGTTDPVTVTDAGLPSQGESGAPAITADGNMVAFESSAKDLASATGVVGTPGSGAVAPAAVIRGASDIYLRDMGARETVLISVTLDRAPAATRSVQPAVAGLGRFTAFVSTSDRLVLKDGNDAADVFIRDLPPMPVLNPAQLDLGSRPVGIESAPLAAVLTNVGWSPLGVAGASIGGANAKDFRVVSQADCQGKVLKRNQACTVSVVFKPTGAGGRAATLTIRDALPTSVLNVALRGRGSLARLDVDPTVGRPGIVVTVDGSGFPRNALVTLRWSRGITQRLDPIKAVNGRFHVSMLVFHNDFIGPRDLIAEPVTPGAFPPVSVPVLVTTPSTIPPQFSLLRFVDLPIVLVFRG